MLSRRELITAGMAGGLAAPNVGGAVAAAAEQDQDLAVQREIARNLGDIEDVLRGDLQGSSLSFGYIAKLRALMEQFLRSHSKFPDYFEIGIGVFMDVYDWHVKNRQQLTVTRVADGRYTLQFMFSTLVLRPDQDPAYIGYPYDKG